jgi:poly(A) polymerase
MTPISPASTDEQAALEIVWRLGEAGFRAYWVGGCVRNRLLGLPAEDIDIATDSRPDQVEEVFDRVRHVGAKFGVCLVSLYGVQTEVATFRTEGPYLDHRRPESVAFAGPEEDARRRDFTINALFFDPIEDRVIDYVGGRKDLEARVVRCVGNPDQRIEEDALRILRGIRFAARLKFEIEKRTFAALGRHARDLEHISAERIRDELVRMLTGPHPARALDLMDAAGALEVILPEVADMRGVAQPPQYHPEGDVWTHTKAALDALENPSPVLAMATLLHDVGKPPTYEEAPDRIRFHNHDDVGAEIAERVCRRLRFSNEEIEAIVSIVKRHMAFLNLQKMRPAKVARFLASPTIDDEIEMHRADCIASHGGLENYEFAREKLEEARTAHPEVLPPPLLTGDDLIKMGYKPGPVYSKILDAVEEQQLEGNLGSREEAKKWVMEQFPAK